MSTIAQRDSYSLDLSTIASVDLGRIAADLEAAQIRAIRRNRAAGAPIRDEVTGFIAQIARIVYAEAACRDKAIREATEGAR